MPIPNVRFLPHQYTTDSEWDGRLRHMAGRLVVRMEHDDVTQFIEHVVHAANRTGFGETVEITIPGSFQLMFDQLTPPGAIHDPPKWLVRDIQWWVHSSNRLASSVR